MYFHLLLSIQYVKLRNNGMALIVAIKLGNSNLRRRYKYMTRIGLIADTHNYLDEAVFKHFDNCHEIWHGGDFGTIAIAEKLAAFKPLKGVFGNIDGQDVRSVYPESLRWTCEAVEVYMTHIGGYPPKYNPAVKKILTAAPPQLFICGHSHILKIMFDDKLQCLHMNPGAAGMQGWHQVRTLIRFTIDGKDMRDCEVIELGRRK
jgi:putative phosphoesterase